MKSTVQLQHIVFKLQKLTLSKLLKCIIFFFVSSFYLILDDILSNVFKESNNENCNSDIFPQSHDNLNAIEWLITRCIASFAAPACVIYLFWSSSKRIENQETVYNHTLENANNEFDQSVDS